MSTKFRPNRGCHAPGHLREAFEQATDLGNWEPLGSWYENLDEDEAIFFNDPQKQAWWENLSPRDRGLWLTGQLWNCTDIMPSTLCGGLDLPFGSTFAQGVRKLRAEME